MKKKMLLGICLALVFLAACGTASENRDFQSENIQIDEVWYPRDTTALDFTGHSVQELEKLYEFGQLQTLNLRETGLTLEQYEALRAALPDCRIAWSVPFQNGYVPEDITEISVTSLCAEDVERLVYLPALKKVDAAGCRDYDQILALQSTHPELEVYYDVPINGQTWPLDTTELVLTDADGEELAAYLPYLPRMNSVCLEGTLPAADILKKLTADFPEIEFYWQIEVCGVPADVNTTELELSNIPMETVEEVETALGYLPNLQRVTMCECGISDEEMDALGQRNPGVRFVWTIYLGLDKVRTDTIAYIPQQTRSIANEEAARLRYCVDMVALDLGHCQYITDCEFVAYMPKLKYLILAETKVTDISPLANHTELVYLELFLTDVTDYTPLYSCTALEDLNICYCTTKAEELARMTWLKRLWWGPYGYQKQALLEMMPDTQVVIGTETSTGMGWRNGQHYFEQRDLLGMYYMR